MTMTETMWLRSRTAQQNLMTLCAYGTAFIGTAAIQALGYGLTAPRVYWTALGRAAGKPAEPVATSPAPLPADVVALMPTAPEPAVVEPVAAATPEALSSPEMPTPEAPMSPLLLDAPRDTGPDDLTALSGIGTKLAQALNEFGIYHYDQIAGLDSRGIDWLEAQQKGFRMTCARYDLVGQAKALG